METREKLSIVTIGHVDHGKSSIIGRLLADMGALPENKMESVKAYCERNARVFEYAFLLDALKEEQSQGITIDAARIFFKTKKRDYIILDAPGHIEFLKNMITGASGAEAALIVIDAKEGVKENSRRHGYLLSLLGVRQVSVIVNKMDLAGYGEEVFRAIVKEYGEFLARVNVRPVSYIPLSARSGENLIKRTGLLSWYDGPTLLEQIESFGTGEDRSALPLRMPVQDIYKFTEGEDDRRLFAGMVMSGKLAAGDKVVFHPSGKSSRVRSVEVWNRDSAGELPAGTSGAITLEDEFYLKPGELIARENDGAPPLTGQRFAANVFWMGTAPLRKGGQYPARIGAGRIVLRLIEIRSVMDASELSVRGGLTAVQRHEVAECVFETNRRIAFDLIADFDFTGRFVIIDSHEIAGAGTIIERIEDRRLSLEVDVEEREKNWDRGRISADLRTERNRHRGKFVLITGGETAARNEIAKNLEEQLFREGCQAYYLGIRSIMAGLDRDIGEEADDRFESFRRLGELGRLMTEAGTIFISAAGEMEEEEFRRLRVLNSPFELLLAQVGPPKFGKIDTAIRLEEGDPAGSASAIIRAMRERDIFSDYQI